MILDRIYEGVEDSSPSDSSKSASPAGSESDEEFPSEGLPSVTDEAASDALKVADPSVSQVLPWSLDTEEAACLLRYYSVLMGPVPQEAEVEEVAKDKL